MLLLSILFACGDKCPEGYEVNEAEKACYPSSDSSDTGSTTTDTNDTNTDTEDTSEDTAEEIVDVFADLSKINGKIIIPSLFEGRVISRGGFWYKDGNELLFYMTANASATCDNASNHLNTEATAQDPSDLFIQDHCNIGVFISDLTDLSSATYFSECTFGTGSFSQQNGEWQWAGTDSNGVAAEFYFGFGFAGETFDVQFDGDRAAIEIEVTEWTGVFPYSTNYNTSAANGVGSGYMFGTECAGLRDSSYWTSQGTEG